MQYLDHAAYKKSLKLKTARELEFINADCKEAIEANPNAEKVVSGYYQDEIIYCRDEQKRRRDRENRRGRDDAMRSLGLTKVRGALGGTYWE